MRGMATSELRVPAPQGPPDARSSPVSAVTAAAAVTAPAVAAPAVSANSGPHGPGSPIRSRRPTANCAISSARSTPTGSRRPYAAWWRSVPGTRRPLRTIRSGASARPGTGSSTSCRGGRRERWPADRGEAVLRAAGLVPYPGADRHHQRHRHPAGRQRPQPHLRDHRDITTRGVRTSWTSPPTRPAPTTTHPAWP